MAKFTNIYKETRGGSPRRGKLKKNWRNIKSKILREEKAKFTKQLQTEIFIMMNQRVFGNEKRSDNSSALPEWSGNTKVWRSIMGYPISGIPDKKLQATGNLKKGFFKSDAGVIIQNNQISVVNNAENKRKQPYAEFLNQKGWTNLEIPTTLDTNGSLRLKKIAKFKLIVKNRYAMELYKK